MKKKILLTFLTLGFLLIAFWVFNKDSETIKDSCDLSVYRFEQDFFSLNPDSFDIKMPLLKSQYPSFFLDEEVDFKRDVFLNDTLQDIFDTVQKFFQDDLLDLTQLQKGFCNYKMYFPNHKLSLYTYIEGTFDYRYPVVYADEKLYVSLDLFLGSNHLFYTSIPEYIKFSHDFAYLPSTCFISLAGRHIPYQQPENFISAMLYYAKAYFFTYNMLPEIQDSVLFKCSQEKINWCINNERVIWEYMIEKDYLFSTSPELLERFIFLAPFSKFGLGVDQKSPGSIGVWLGLQIIKSYVKNNNISLVDLLSETDYIKILNQSGYKP
ncbi:MAG: hypothetical protein CMD27_03075 [Flavobacteriales bacterium]|jgi:hypothetical protein|nr:hypothetical protein [Flavobacteriales bacterium]